MRWPLIVIALFVAFVLWDRFANDGAYTAQIERSFSEASLQPSGGNWSPPTITIRNPLQN